MARGSKKQQAGGGGAAAAAALPPGAIATADQVFVPVELTSSGDEAPPSGAAAARAEAAASSSEASGPETDTTADLLGGNYEPDIVNEVRTYAKPAWEQEPSSLDPIEDIETFYDYDFKLPPDAYDAYTAAAQVQLRDLEAMKAGADPAAAALIEQRRALVAGKTADELRWLKHKAYYKGMQQIRAAKAAAAAANAELEDTLAAAAALQAAEEDGGAPAQQQQEQEQEHDQQQWLGLFSEDEVLAQVSDASEWDSGWTAPGYAQHPEVLQQLRSAYAAGFGLPAYRTPAQAAAEREEHWQALKQLHSEAERAAAADEAAKQRLIAAHTPHQAYAPDYLAAQKRQQQLAAHRRHKQQAFWLSLGVALGSSFVRWWQQRGRSAKQQQKRRGQAGPRRTGSGASSRRSTRPPTPSGMAQQQLARESIPE